MNEQHWDWLKHEDNLLVSRGNYFMVAESMLFAAAAQLLSLKSHTPFVVLAVFGILVACIWLLAGHRQVSETIDLLKTELRKDAGYGAIDSQRTSDIGGPTRLIAYVLPLLAMGAWLAMLVVTASEA